MTPAELRAKAEALLLDLSSDDGWIDASSGWAKKQLERALRAAEAAGYARGVGEAAELLADEQSRRLVGGEKRSLAEIYVDMCALAGNGGEG